MSFHPSSSRATVSLVALCFVAILGIVLASYIAVCSRAMNLSNRSFQSGLGHQLAEFGLEEGLRAFNKNDWSGWSNGISVTWDTTTYAASKRAVGTITFPAGKFGQGTSATLKIRIDNFDAAVLGSSWVSSGTYPTYRVGELVERNGVWYRCVQQHSTTQTPNGMANMGYWVPAPVPSIWDSAATYKSQDVVYYTTTPSNGWYRYTNASSSAGNLPTNGTYWTSIPKVSVDGAYSSISGEVLNYFGTWYYYSSGWRATPNPPNSYAPIVSWVWRQSYNYSFNDLVCYGNTWYRCIAAHTSSSTITTASGSYWENALSTMSGWSSSSVNYNLGSIVYYASNSRWYRCIKAHTSSGSYPPTNTTYWATTPPYSTVWESTRQYASSDLVRYNGLWYRCLQANNNTPPPPNSSYWASPTDNFFAWSPTTAYTAGSLIRYGGAWYTCLVANTGQSPNNTTHWTATRQNSAGVSTGAPVIYAESTVSISGSPAIKTQLRALISPASLFPNAAAATTALALNTGTVDSYDSNSPTYAVTTSAVLASGSSMTITGGLTVKGYLAWPSPPAGINDTVTLNGAAYSTDKSRVSRSPSIPAFAIQPVVGGTQLSTLTATLGTAGSSTPSVYYYDNGVTTNLTLNSSTEIITIAGPTILYVAGTVNINTSTSARIRILPSGSLRLVVDGNFRIQSSGGGIENLTNDPSKCTILCTKSGSATLDFSATAYPFYGTIYIPNSTSTLTVGAGVEIFGAVSAQNITFGDNIKLHYDTALRSEPIDGVDQPYSITELRELPQTEQATMP